jgi:MFS family permease
MPRETRTEASLGGPFWRLWSAGAVNNVGDGALAIGVSLLAADLTSDPRLVASVAAAAMLPWILVSIPAGVLVDRADPVRIVRAAQLAQASAMIVLAVLAATHHVTVWELAVLAFTATAGDVVYNVAAQSMLPRLVPAAGLTRANSLIYLAQILGYTIIGQALGGTLFASATAAPFALEAGSYVACMLLLTRLRIQPIAVHADDSADRVGTGFRRVYADTIAGFRFLLGHRLLRVLAIVLGLNVFANQLATSVLVLFATRILGVSHAQYGWLVATSAGGSLLGGLVNTRIVRRVGQRAALIAALTVNAAGFAGIAFTTGAIAAGALLAAIGLSITVWNVVSVTIRQTLVPHELLGRVNSINRLLGWGLIPAGALAGGYLAHTFGLRPPFLIAGGVRFTVLLAALPSLLRALTSEQEPTRQPTPDA